MVLAYMIYLPCYRGLMAVEFHLSSGILIKIVEKIRRGNFTAANGILILIHL